MQKFASALFALFALVSVTTFAEPAEGDRKAVKAKKVPLVSLYNEEKQSLEIYEVAALPAELQKKENNDLSEAEREALVKNADVEKLVLNGGKKVKEISVAKLDRDRTQSTEACFFRSWCWGGWYQPVYYSYYVPRYIGYCGFGYGFGWGYRNWGFYC